MNYNVTYDFDKNSYKKTESKPIDFFDKLISLSNENPEGNYPRIGFKNKVSWRNVSDKPLNKLEKLLLLESEFFIKEASKIFEDRQSIIVLTDREGYIISMEKNQGSKIIEDGYFEDLSLISEDSPGNQSITLSILGKSLEVIRGEEVIVNENILSVSVPIIINEKLLGSLTITGLIEDSVDMVKGILEYTSKVIENNMKNKMKKEDRNRELLIASYSNTVLECINDGFLIIDKDGVVQYINKVGAEILGIDQFESIGKHVEGLVEFKPVILEVLESGKGHVDREYFIKGDKTGENYHFIKTMMPIKNDEGEIIGVVDNFRRIKRVKKMVNSIVGNQGSFTFKDIIGSSSSLQYCKSMAMIASESDSRVLITGESGTGKELFVQSIHNASSRSKNPIIAINCSAIPNELFEAELFGYEAGSFTGALKSGKMGKFELANGGTIFLDEIGDMPLHMQAKLLRVLQEGKVTRVGSKDSIDIDVRVISATNKDLLKESKKGNFREDLYYRLNVLNIHIPALRERKEDILALSNNFIRVYNEKLDKNVKYVSNEASLKLLEYDWPGNVRELENVIERAINLCDSDTLEIIHLPEFINKLEKVMVEDHYERQLNQNLLVKNEEAENKPIEIKSIMEMEKDLIVDALDYFNGNISKASKALKISRNTLYNKIEKYGV